MSVCELSRENSDSSHFSLDLFGHQLEQSIAQNKQQYELCMYRPVWIDVWLCVSSGILFSLQVNRGTLTLGLELLPFLTVALDLPGVFGLGLEGGLGVYIAGVEVRETGLREA